MGITLDQLKQHFGSNYTDAQLEQAYGLLAGTIDPSPFPRVKAWVDRCYNSPDLEEMTMVALDEVLQTHGVEAVIDGPDATPIQPQAAYLNMGDTYDATILYIPSTGEYLLTSWGDYVESLGYEDE